MQRQLTFAEIVRRLVPLGCIAIALATGTAAAQARPASIAAAMDHCATTKPNSGEQAGTLNEARTILCFDAGIRHYLDLTPVLRLREGGLAVVRSSGGSLTMAMSIADVLWERNATVVIRDYCLSACANALFVATQQTYVAADTIVAWHGGPANCADHRAVALLKRIYRECNDYGRTFYEKRGLDRMHMSFPPTNHTQKLVYVALDGALEKTSVFWMWHPANHRSYFKNRITYEAYPESQFAVEAIAGRFFRNAVRIIYDHPAPR
jgi:hypothetical protein